MGCCNNPNYQNRAARESINRSAYEACQCATQACECKDVAVQAQIAAQASAVSAASDANQSEAIWNDFQTRYLGAYAVAPVTSTTGALYFNTVSNTMFVWNGTSWQTADFNEFTAFLATGTTTARNLVTRTSDIFNVKDFGAVGDGVFDCEPAFQAAINAALASGGGTIYIPKGTYNFPKTTTAAKLDPGLGNLTFKGDGYTSSILKYWEGTTTTFPQSNLFKNVTNNPLKGPLIFKDIQIQGSLGIRSGRFGNPLYCDYYPEVIIDGCKFYNIAAEASDFHYCKSVKCINSHFENIAADGIRARDCFDFIVTGNKFVRIGDDAIANHTAENTLLTFVPQRERIIISNNTIVNGRQFVRCIAAKKTVITGNTIHLAGGIDLRRNYENPPGTILEGGNPAYEINISNNSFTDPFTGACPAWIYIESNVKSGSSTNNTIPGDYNSTTSSFVFPWDYTQTDITTASNSLPRTFNLSITNNTFSRTRSAVAAFSDYGYGTRLFQGISSNPPYTDTDLTYGVAIALAGQFENFLISGNVIKDVLFGISINGNANPAAVETADKLLKNGIISNNTIFNSRVSGIFAWGGLGGIGSAGLFIFGNSINCDPYRLNANSNIDGTYDSDAEPRGIWLQGIQSAEILNNTLSNCCQLFIGVTDNHISNNIAHCSTPIASGFNIGNKGIGNILANNNWIYIIQDSDPTSPTYLNFVSRTIETDSAMPSSGWYYRGWFVKNTTPSLDANNMSILGWLRLTTGTGHVSGTDWAIARVSHVSPAT